MHRLCLVLSLLITSCATACAAEWRGWRGDTHDGRAIGTGGPTHWSRTHNVVWKTAIPGQGHSSPIVTEKAVYVTTARIIPTNPVLLKVTRFALVGAICFLGALAMRFVTARCRVREVSLRSLVALATFLSLTIAIGTLVFFGDTLLDFGRAVERPWLAACLVGTLCLALSGICGSNARTALIASLALFAFAGVLAATIPDPAHTVQAGALSPVSLLIYAVIVVPVIAGCLMLSACLARSRAIAVVFRIVAVFSAVGSVAVLGRIVTARPSATNATYTTSALHQPVVGWWIPVASVLVLIGLLLGRRKSPESPVLNCAVVISGACTGLALIIALIEHLVSRVTFLSYLLGTPDLKPMLGWGAVAAFVVVSVIATAAAMISEPRNRNTEALILSPLFRATGVTITILYFVYANRLPKDPLLERCIVSVNRGTGKIEWISRGLRGAKGVMHSDNSPATPTPVTDGERIYAYFGTPGLLCTDLRGNHVWVNTQLPFQSREGVGSSPILFDGKVIVLSESDAGNYLAAVDCHNGKLRWRTERGKRAHSYAGNCRTPCVKRVRGRPVIVVWGHEDLSGYEVLSGRELWSYSTVELPTSDNPVSSLVADDRRVYLAGMDRTVAVDCERLGDRDLVFAWVRDVGAGTQCSTPVVSRGLVFAISDGGSAFCLEVATGKELWRKQLDGQHYASVVASERSVYFYNTKGSTTVIAGDRDGGIMSRNDLGEGIFASPALVDRDLFIRTVKHVYCLREQHLGG